MFFLIQLQYQPFGLIVHLCISFVNKRYPLICIFGVMLILFVHYLYNTHFSFHYVSIKLFGNNIYLFYEWYDFVYNSKLAVPVSKQIFAANITNLFLFHPKYVILIEKYRTGDNAVARYSFKEKGVSLYYHVEKYIRQKIESREWAPGTKLPPESELADFFNVSRTTIRQAVDGMVEAGILIRKQGSGTYVTQQPYARSRLEIQPSDAVCKYIYGPIIQDDMSRSYQDLLKANIAHVLMLCRQHIISQDDSVQLTRFLLSLQDKHPQNIGVNPVNEDYHLSLEQYIISKLGYDLGGKISVARSRNDATPAVIRMGIRAAVLTISNRLSELISRILELAQENTDRIITGYTHCQPSQPTTLGHYFLAIAEALLRDFDRLLSAYPRLNISPIGACAMCGTSHPIDRNYIAHLLGFDGIVTNTLDAVAARDYLMEYAAVFSTLGSTLSRMAQDLYLWSTVEFGYVSFSDSTCCGSSHMPQKRNALSVEHIRSKTAHLCSSYLDIVMAMKGTTYSHSRDLFECMPPFWNSAETLTGILELYLDLFHDITFHYDRMEQLAKKHYTFATDLADLLVKREDISFRQAHNIVAAVVKAKDDNASEISLNELEQPFFQSIGRHLSIQADELSGVCSIRHCINSKTCDGSPAPLSCQKMLSLCRSQLGRDTDALSMIEGQLQQADIFFQKQLDNLLQSENNPI